MRRETTEQVVTAILEGNHELFRTLIDATAARVSRIVAAQGVYATDVDDVVQETYLRAFRSLKTFRTDGRFELWVSGIAVRTAKEYWRRTSRRREAILPNDSEVDFFDTIPDETAGPDERIEDRETRSAVRAALARLTPDQKSAISLFYFEDLSVHEIGSATGWSVSKVKVLLHRGRNKLAAHLGHVQEERR